MLLNTLNKGFSACASPVMLISRKVIHDKKVVTGFRHLNLRIARNNMVYTLLKDTFLVLGSSRCEVLPVLDLKDAFHSLRLSENPKRLCGILPYFSSTSYLYQRMPKKLKIIYWKYHFIKDRRVCVKLLRSRVEAIQKLKIPTTVKGCRIFAVMVNFLHLFCLQLQKLLKPIYDLTRKGRKFLLE